MDALATSTKEDYSNWVTALGETHREVLSALSDVQGTDHLLRHPRYLQDKAVLERATTQYEFFPAPEKPKTFDRDFVRLCAWNVERGIATEAALEELQKNPSLSDADVYFITEVDFGMARSGNRHVARDLGQALGLHTVFGPAFLNIDLGNGAEALTANGQNTVALQGHAFLSRFPIEDIELVPLPDGKDHVKGKERQIGQEKAILATVKTPRGPLHVGCIHISAHSSRKHRARQLEIVVKAISKRPGPAVIGGDWNTTTYNTHHAIWAILGFWRRIMIGAKRVMEVHYPYPGHYFEKGLFEMLKQNGFETDSFNDPGKTTVHYNFNEAQVSQSLGDWVPNWCFKFIRWGLGPFGGNCSFKLDWFTGRDLRADNARVVYGLPRGLARITDHEPILVDVRPLLQKEGHA